MFKELKKGHGTQCLLKFETSYMYNIAAKLIHWYIDTHQVNSRLSKQVVYHSLQEPFTRLPKNLVHPKRLHISSLQFHVLLVVQHLLHPKKIPEKSAVGGISPTYSFFFEVATTFLEEIPITSDVLFFESCFRHCFVLLAPMPITKLIEMLLFQCSTSISSLTNTCLGRKLISAILNRYKVQRPHHWIFPEPPGNQQKKTLKLVGQNLCWNWKLVPFLPRINKKQNPPKTPGRYVSSCFLVSGTSRTVGLGPKNGSSWLGRRVATPINLWEWVSGFDWGSMFQQGLLYDTNPNFMHYYFRVIISKSPIHLHQVWSPPKWVPFNDPCPTTP